MSNFDFEPNTLKARASSIGHERQFDSQLAVKQAIPFAKRSPLDCYDHFANGIACLIAD